MIKRTMSGKAHLSLFEEIVKLTPFVENGQRQGRIILFMTLSSSLPLGGMALQGNMNLSSRNAKGTPCPWGWQSWGTSDVGGTEAPSLQLGVGSWSSTPVGLAGAGLGPASPLPRLYSLKLCFVEPNPSHSCLCILGRRGRGGAQEVSKDQEWWREGGETRLFQGCCWQRWGHPRAS